MTGKVGRPRKVPADPWKIVDQVTLDNNAEVTVWENSGTQERRVTPRGFHPAQQPLADDDPVVEELLEDTAENRIQAMMVQARDTGSVLRLYRVERSGKLSWVEDFSPTEWEAGGERMVRETYGPGDYEVRLWQKGTRSPLRGKLQMHIAAPRLVSPAVVVPPPTTDPNLTQILASIAENQRVMLQAITERPALPDPTLEMAKMLQLMVSMRQAMGVDQQPRSQISEIVSAIRELREASDEIAPKDDPPGLIGQLPKVLDLIAAQQQGAPAAQDLPLVPVHVPATLMPDVAARPKLVSAPPKASAAPKSAAVVSPPASDPTGESNVFNPLAILQLKAYLKTLLNMATRNDPLAKGVDFVVEKMPDEIVDIMMLDSWWELLESVEPSVKPHQAWLTQVRDAAVKQFDIEDDASQPEDGSKAA